MDAIQTIEQAIEALEIERVMGADEHGNYTIEVTPKKILSALKNLRALLEDMKKQEPVAWLNEEVNSWWVTKKQTYGEYERPLYIIPQLPQREGAKNG